MTSAAALIDSLICERCSWPHEACPCVRSQLDVQRLQREVKAQHRASVARARGTRKTRRRAA